MSKWILSLFVLVGTTQAQALIVNGEASPHCVIRSPNGTLFDCFLPFSTTFFPTIVIYGQSLDLNSLEASDRLAAEADGVAQPVVLGQIAKSNGLEFEHVKAVAAGLSDLTMRNLMKALQQ
ncbi:hypothetical protein ACLVWU_10515 [Bdellovibrio sp. HCB290]|uniref:hypothetical protein n=1 Tax=Bdellovibrio sp. HCB290 TaxID=3394356 RepID=UPI0039B59E7E